MIKEICKEVDICIENRALSKKLVDLIRVFMKNTKALNSRDSDMVLSLDSEIDMFIAGRLTNDPKFDESAFTSIPMPDWLVDCIKETKEENIEFWN